MALHYQVVLDTIGAPPHQLKTKNPQKIHQKSSIMINTPERKQSYDK